MDPDVLRVLFSEDDIHKIVRDLAQKVQKDYTDKVPLVVCILKGAVIFMTDFVREYNGQLEMDFMDVSSYAGASSTGEVRILKDLDSSVKDRDVLILEDIIDTGATLQSLTELFGNRGANSVRICTLFDKPSGRKVFAHTDYVGASVPDEFIVGYGMDYNERYRNLPYVGVLKPAVYTK
ncbi:hypoxanthine phosphoribosyltransferase [Lacticaseibacillus zhaodongensis]|uniref:hypoxanthine phosphoribosyltransferase n=1 Tax=Lacticaseibacillus zhaodongensis TaxID=2668065 RepID=UPI0012D36949|nr:hypoxanthine phosphoribosyltransferase [Lacticaseibacillus zhaodongensis]